MEVQYYSTVQYCTSAFSRTTTVRHNEKLVDRGLLVRQYCTERGESRQYRTKDILRTFPPRKFFTVQYSEFREQFVQYNTVVVVIIMMTLQSYEVNTVPVVLFVRCGVENTNVERRTVL